MKEVFDSEKYQSQILGIFNAVSALYLARGEKTMSDKMLWHKMQQILREFPKDGNTFFSRDEIISGFKWLAEKKTIKLDQELVELIRLKPTRTISGVATVTVLTKPFPCPGNCIFCPNDIRMPKSYIASEPGAQRAGRNSFDPYLQTYNRLLALESIGHNISKIELIVLGGTWSFYPEDYQIWFIKRCYDALNDFGIIDRRNTTAGIDFTDTLATATKAVKYNQLVTTNNFEQQAETTSWDELFKAQRINETAICRNVGLVLETRPDYLTAKEVIRLRKLGATKIQIGIQSLNDEILEANKRGTTVAQIKNAFKLLRLAGFKIHGHMMPNLYKATPESDLADYQLLFSEDFAPDELKIYPTSVIKGTLLYELAESGDYRPYDTTELIELLKKFFLITPRYCRLTRVVRDIPSQEISVGNKITNLRQIVELQMQQEQQACQCIRCREIKSKQVAWQDIDLEEIIYETTVTTEYFISYKTKKQDKICGFLRLAIVKPDAMKDLPINELNNTAIIREVHVYGKVTDFGKKALDHTQHLGIGTALELRAEEIAKANKLDKISVISAIGTREYYRKLGFELAELYMHKHLYLQG